MISMPWRTHCLMDWPERAWADTRLPRIFVSFTATATSSSLIHVVPAGAEGMKLSPERLSLIESTPYFRNIRTARRISPPRATPPRAGPAPPEGERGKGGGRRGLVAGAAHHRDLLARGQVARPRDQPLVDG